jgi:hypothetical protein
MQTKTFMKWRLPVEEHIFTQLSADISTAGSSAFPTTMLDVNLLIIRTYFGMKSGCQVSSENRMLSLWHVRFLI